MRLLVKLSRILDDVTSTMSGILMSILTIATLAGVFYRYVLGSPLDWIYELTIVSFSWMIFLGVAMAFKNNEHIAIGFVVENLPLRAKYIVKQVIHLIIIVFLTVAFYHGLKVTMGTMKQFYDTIPVPKGVFYLAFPVAAVPSIVHVVVASWNLREAYKEADKGGVR